MTYYTGALPIPSYLASGQSLHSKKAFIPNVPLPMLNWNTLESIENTIFKVQRVVLARV